MTTALQEAIDHYRSQGAPEDQTMLIALLREAQELCGGALSPAVLMQISQSYHIRETALHALIRRIPSLRTQAVPHTLELCSRCAAKLAVFVERELGVAPGQESESAGFSCRMTGCMKNCKCGPSIRWDGELHSRADEALLRRLTQK